MLTSFVPDLPTGLWELLHTLEEPNPFLLCKIKTKVSFPKVFFFFSKALLKSRKSKLTYNETPKSLKLVSSQRGPSHPNVQERKPKVVLIGGTPWAQKHGELSSPHLAGIGGALPGSHGKVWDFQSFKNCSHLLFGCGPPLGHI